eukprot:TRINITY_DN4875_c0_g1_i1.p1 TRINITY_DN4875_c0_g1~~TRINITY_DN4875_c0_g1_i1.p1  ORF type:complete len:680 (+),score=161.31 TRINITY_DN4875_c0_g1_i1:76-2115(+)
MCIRDRPAPAFPARKPKPAIQHSTSQPAGARPSSSGSSRPSSGGSSRSSSSTPSRARSAPRRRRRPANAVTGAQCQRETYEPQSTVARGMQRSTSVQSDEHKAVAASMRRLHSELQGSEQLVSSAPKKLHSPRAPRRTLGHRNLKPSNKRPQSAHVCGQRPTTRLGGGEDAAESLSAGALEQRIGALAQRLNCDAVLTEGQFSRTAQQLMALKEAQAKARRDVRLELPRGCAHSVPVWRQGSRAFLGKASIHRREQLRIAPAVAAELRHLWHIFPKQDPSCPGSTAGSAFTEALLHRAAELCGQQPAVPALCTLLPGHPFSAWLQQHRGEHSTLDAQALCSCCEEFLQTEPQPRVVCREVYSVFGRLVHDFLVPGGGPCEAIVQDQWQLESGGLGWLTERALQWSLFELADIWCLTEEPQEYATFLACLRERLSLCDMFQCSTPHTAVLQPVTSEPEHSTEDPPSETPIVVLPSTHLQHAAQPAAAPIAAAQHSPPPAAAAALHSTAQRSPAQRTHVPKSHIQAARVHHTEQHSHPVQPKSRTQRPASSTPRRALVTPSARAAPARARVVQRPQTAGPRARHTPHCFTATSALDTHNEGYERRGGHFHSDTWYNRGMDGALAQVDGMKRNGQHTGCPSVWAGVKSSDRAALFQELVHNSDKRPLLLKLLNGSPRTLYEG